MIPRKPTSVEVAQGAGTALAIAGLVMLLPLGWVFLIVGGGVASLATWVELKPQLGTSKRATRTDGG